MSSLSLKKSKKAVEATFITQAHEIECGGACNPLARLIESTSTESSDRRETKVQQYAVHLWMHAGMLQSPPQTTTSTGPHVIWNIMEEEISREIQRARKKSSKPRKAVQNKMRNQDKRTTQHYNTTDSTLSM
jgi:hypothetical protein